jgi:FlaA1/EpsC-like NDP-sugar epimerase
MEAGMDPDTIRALLGRDPLTVEAGPASDWVRGRRVLVTGGGGSIGAALVLRIAASEPAELVVLERDERALVGIEQRLAREHPTIAVHGLLADVGDHASLDRILTRHAPEVLLHTAAYKHLPLVERQPLQGLANNLLATWTAAALADAHGVGTFLFLSTDKAAAPTSVLGASKRAAERLCRDLASRSATRFVVVRFGNVLGSSGSVLPVFEAQVAAGGPVTVTHREVERFFISVDEGVQLILHAGATARSGDTLVLDPGPPIRIADLADRVIRRAGRVPGRDIEIRYTALSDGEKLREVLVGPDEVLVGTGAAGVLRAQRREPDPGLDLGPLETAVAAGDEAAALTELQRLVPSFRRSGPTPPPPAPRALRRVK